MGEAHVGQQGRLAVALDLAKGLRLERIMAAATDGRETVVTRLPMRVFQIRVVSNEGEAVIDSTDMRVTGDSGIGGRGHISMEHAATGIQARLSYRPSGEDEMSFELSLTSPEDRQVHIIWPVIEGLWADQDPERTCHFHPRSSGIYRAAPAAITSNYGQYVRLQTMAAFSPAGEGVYIIVKDTDPRRRSFELVKNVPDRATSALKDSYGYVNWDGLSDAPGIGMAVQSRALDMKAEAPLRLPPVAVGLASNGMAGVIEAYQRWAASWYKPSRVARFRDTFNYRAMPIFDAATPEEVIQRIGDDTIDLLHFMVQSKHVNGEYAYRDDWGIPGIRRLIAALRERGILSSHYIEGYIAWKDSQVFRQHGDAWGQKRGGQNVVAFANMAMCPSAEGWQQWLANVCSGLVRDFDFDAVYLDEVGWGTLDKYVCEHPDHQHPPAFCGLRSARQLLGQSREAIRRVDQDTPLLTEGPAVDQLFTVLDGVQDYGCRDAFHLPQWYHTPVHWPRFFFPDFKFFDITAGLPLEQEWQLRRTVFNGNGFMSHGHGPNPTRPVEERITGLYRLCRDAFAGNNVQPMIPTRHHGVFANRFTSPGKQITTVCNVNEYPVAGELIDLPAQDGMHYVDLWRNSEVPTRLTAGRHRLILQLAPQGIAVVARLDRKIKITQDGLWFTVDQASGTRLLAVRVGPDGDEITSSSLRLGEPFSLAQLALDAQARLVLRTLHDGVLVDQHQLPLAGDIDLARFAQAAAGNADKPHGANPGAVNDGDKGTGWDLRWDDEHPGWVQLTWSRPQRVNSCSYRYSRSEYSPRKADLQYRDAGGQWVTIVEQADRGNDVFEDIETDSLRLLIHEGGPWANRALLNDWQVRWRPGASE